MLESRWSSFISKQERVDDLGENSTNGYCEVCWRGVSYKNTVKMNCVWTEKLAQMLMKDCSVPAVGKTMPVTNYLRGEAVLWEVSPDCSGED